MHPSQSASVGDGLGHARPVPSGNLPPSDERAATGGASSKAGMTEAARMPKARAQQRDLHRRPDPRPPQPRPHAAGDRPHWGPNSHAQPHRAERGVPTSSMQPPGRSNRTPATATSNMSDIPKSRAAPPPPPPSHSQKIPTARRPPAPPPPPLRIQHSQQVACSHEPVKVSPQTRKEAQKPRKPTHKAKSFGDSEDRVKNNSSRSNAHARTDLRPLHVAEIAPPRVRVNVRTVNGADARRNRRGGRTVGPGSAFAAVSAALGRRRGALQPSAAIVDTSIADAVATPSGVRARERTAERFEKNSPRSAKNSAHTRDVTPIAQGVSTMLKALTLLHVSRTAGMTGASSGQSRSQGARDADGVSDVDSEAEKENETRTNERKVGRIAWASKKKLEDVMSKLAGQSAKGERFVMKARPQLSDLADANNDVYFQKLMNDDR